MPVVIAEDRRGQYNFKILVLGRCFAGLPDICYPAACAANAYRPAATSIGHEEFSILRRS